MNKIIKFIQKKSQQYASEALMVQTKTEAIMNKPTMQFTQGLAVVLLMTVTPLACASGFEAEGKAMAQMIYKGIYGIVGVVAAIVVLWQCVEGWSGRKSWMDILATCFWVVGAAASMAFVTWLWQKGQGMSFG